MRTNRRAKRSRLTPLRRAAAKGSVLIASYFLVMVVLGLAIPQTTRSLASLQVESRFLDRQRTWQVGEAGIDDAIRLFYPSHPTPKPEFGNVSYSADGTFPCPDAPSTWDCFDPTIPALTSGTTYRLRAKDEGTPEKWAGSGKGLVWKARKRVRVLATSAMNQVNWYEVALVVERQALQNNIQGGVTGVDKVTLGQGATIDGDVTSFGSGQEAVWLKSGAKIKGKVTVGPSTLPGAGTPGAGDSATRLCCDDNDAIHLSSSGAEIQTTGGMPLADNANGNTNVGGPNPTDIDAAVGGDAQVPTWRMAGVAVVPTPLPAACTGANLIDHTVVAPGGNIKFCPPGFAASCNVNVQGVGVDTTGDGLADRYEYCFRSLHVRSNAEIQFGGDSVRVFTTEQVGGSGWGIEVGQDALMYSFPPTVGSPSYLNAEELAIHIPCPPGSPSCGTTYGVFIRAGARLLGGIYAPLGDIKLGVDTDTDPLIGNMEVEGYVFGKTVWLRAGGNIRIKKSDELMGNVQKVRLLGWRKCRSPYCTPD